MQHIVPSQRAGGFWTKCMLGLFLLGAVLLTTANPPKTLAFTSHITTPPLIAEYLLYSNSATHIQVIPLVTTGLPDLNSGIAVTASAYCASDTAKPARSKILPIAGEWITIWHDEDNDQSCYSRFTSDGYGGFAEAQLGSWPVGWAIVGADDLNNDSLDDLLLQHKVTDGYSNYQYQVALGQVDGSFDFNAAPVTYATNQWVARTALADANDDGHADFVYYTFAHGGRHDTAIKLLAGVGDGTFNNTAQALYTSPHGANKINLADFDGDGDLDIYLAPDDDVNDMGQSYLAFKQGAGYQLQESLDFRPNDESSTSNEFSASALAYDVNMDGRVDLVTRLQEWDGGPYSAEVYWGDGTGTFATSGATVLSGFNTGDPYIPTLEWGPLMTYTPPHPSETALYISSSTGGRVEGIRFADEDILAFDPLMDCWVLFFDGSDVGLRKHDLNAFHIVDHNTILLSLNKPIKLSGVTYDDSDIIKFQATSLGIDTAGSFSLYFDGSDVKLTRAGEDIDAISLTANGDLVISTLGTAKVGFTARDEDLLRFQALSLGEDTIGSWSHYFDGSDIALTSKTEDVWAVWIDPQSEEIQLSTQGKYAVKTAGTTLKGDGDDIFVCDPIILGSSTQCDFDLFWNGDRHDYGREKIDGYSVSTIPSGPLFNSLGIAVTINSSQVEDADWSPEANDREDDDVLDDDDFTGQIYMPIINNQ